MHAARAIHKQREKREEKARLDVRRPSAISQSSRRVSRSPAVSVDTSARKSQSHDDEPDNLNFSYIGFIIAVFGAVPLIVGTFVEVPALWEIGLGVTLLGLFIGVVFWCTELCAEAKRFSQKKNQLSTRGKIEDSNLLHVPDRKFGNGLDSRRSSFQSDSVSLISPAVQHYSPKHHTDRPQHNPGSRHSISQYSSDFSTSSGRANGHLVPPALILRGNGRKDDGRVVSLVQPDPGLDDDSDSDAETVIEAPSSHHSTTKMIQVQSCQERQYAQHDPSKPLLGTSFNIENEKISPLSQQHRTIRMPVMPQEIDKLQRCECGRYLLTERDKLIGIKLPGIGGSSSGSTTTSNSPVPTSSLPVPGNAATLQNKTLHRNSDPSLEDSINDNNNIAGGGGSNVATPLADLPPPPPPNKIISVKNPPVRIAPPIPPTPQNTGGTLLTSAESIVQVDPTLSSSKTTALLAVTSAREKTEDMDIDFDDEEDEVDGDMTPGNEYVKTFQETAVVVEEEDDKIINELLELTDVNDDEGTKEKMEPEQRLVEQIRSKTSSNDENHNMELEMLEQRLATTTAASNKELLQLSREGSRRRFLFQSQATSITRPTSLPLPSSLSLSEAEVKESSANNNLTAGSNNPSDETSTEPVTNTAQANDNLNQGQQIRVQSAKEKNSLDLAKQMSLEELLDSIEKNQEGEVLAVVVQ